MYSAHHSSFCSQVAMMIGDFLDFWSEPLAPGPTPIDPNATRVCVCLLSSPTTCS